VRSAACLDQHGVERRSCALAHGAEQVRFIPEMPVTAPRVTPAAAATSARGGLCHPPIAEYPLGCVEQLFARDSGLNFGFADHLNWLRLLQTKIPSWGLYKHA
jgi:hypothetical protein